MDCERKSQARSVEVQGVHEGLFSSHFLWRILGVRVSITSIDTRKEVGAVLACQTSCFDFLPAYGTWSQFPLSCGQRDRSGVHFEIDQARSTVSYAVSSRRKRT